jgi:hypothetical protein
MMNCLEFRRRLTVDPLDADDALRAHEETCDDCSRFARQIRADEIRLRAMLRSVTPPEGMADRIQIAVRTERLVKQRRRGWFAAAAGVVIAVAGGLLALGNWPSEANDPVLVQSILNHIEDEAVHLREVDPVSTGAVRFVFARFDARLIDDIGPVLFAAECPMRAHTGVHLVLPGHTGPITVFFMPGESVDGEVAVGSARFRGYVTPTAWGSIAVVGEQGEDLGGMGERLALAVDWPLGGAAQARTGEADAIRTGEAAQVQSRPGQPNTTG